VHRKAGPDAQLVARAREGDLDAFDRLLARHRARVFDIARQIVGDREAAQDVAQEALLRAFRALSTLRDGDRFGVWLNTIVRRQAQRWLRDRGRRPEPVETERLVGVPVGVRGSVPEGAGEVVARIRQALTVLSQRQRQVVILHYLEGRSCEEIAGQLGVSVGTVKRILHYSRHKVRRECAAMGQEQDAPRGPRRLTIWTEGSASHGYWNVDYRLRHALAQTMCLIVNKEPKTISQIAEEAGAAPDYIADEAGDLEEAEVLVSPKKGSYLANFIAFDAEDWRRLMRLVPEPAAKAAQGLAAAESKLRAAFAQTPLGGSGWAWEEVAWVVYGVLVANYGASRNGPDSHRLRWPERPGGGRYWVGGYEEVPNLPTVWTTGFNAWCTADLGGGFFWTWGLDRERPALFAAGEDANKAIVAVAESALTEKEALARLRGDAEHWREILASLVKEGFLKKANGKLQPGIPVFTKGDSDVLTPAADAVVKPVIEDIVVPALADLSSVLDKMGYRRRRDQYPEWHRWVASNIMGEALHFLMEQGVLPRPPKPAPPSFACLAWKGDLRMMDSGVPD